MNAGLLSVQDMADEFNVTPAKVLEWNRVYKWPHIKIGRKFYWSPEQLAAITKAHTKTGADLAAAKDPRTKRSAARSK